MLRCASTWSTPPCASSSVTKSAESFHIGVFDKNCHNPAQRKVVVRHIRSAVGIAVLRARISGVIVRQANHDERRNLSRSQPPLEIALKLSDPKLVRNAEIECRITAGRSTQKPAAAAANSGTAVCPSGSGPGHLRVALELQPLAVIQNPLPLAATCSHSDPNCGSSSGMGASAPPNSARLPGCARPQNRCRRPPYLEVHAVLKNGVGLIPITHRCPSAETSRVHIKVIAHGELRRQRMQIGRDLQMRRGFFSPAAHPSMP